MSHFHKQIIIIRHGEKPKDKDCFGLSQKGLARSAYLVDYFADPVSVKGHVMYNKPDKIYCFDEHTGINRSKQLMQPLIDSHHIPYNCEYNDHTSGTTQMVNNIFTNDANLIILICWEHNIIPELIQLIGKHIDCSNFDKFKCWSDTPEKGKTDEDEYGLTIVINPEDKSLIMIDQSNDFSKNDQLLKKLDNYKIIYKLQ